MKNKVAILSIIAPLVFCYMKSTAGLNTLNMHQTQWAVYYAFAAILLWDKRSKKRMYAAVFNGLVSILNLYVYLPPMVVKSFPILSNQLYCLSFMGLIAFGLYKLIARNLHEAA